MNKFLLIVIVLLLVYWIIKSGLRRNNRNANTRASAKPGEDMVRCAGCGVHLPRSEGLLSQGRYYCCAEHQHLSGS